MVPDGRYRATRFLHAFGNGEVANSGGGLVQRNASLRSESRHRHERGALPGRQQVFVACQEVEGYRIGRFLRTLIAQRSCEV
jgi:hypothetical protein